MNFSWKIVRAIMTIVGSVMAFGAVGTLDYYSEAGQPEPSYIWTTLVIGMLMVLPMLIHIIKERWQDDVQDR